MAHKVFILDDIKPMAESIEASIRSEDRDATVVTSQNVHEAKQRLDGHCSEFRYGVVDLHLGNNLSQDGHGEAFLEWLSGAGWLQRVRVLVVSHDEDRLRKLPRGIFEYVTIKKRTASNRENSLMIRQFVREVLSQPMEAGTPRP
jgi:response regulator of citrate/malate metabolism